MLPLEIKHDVSERTNGVVNGRKRKREDEEPTQSIMLPLEIKHDISERINGIVNRLRIMGKSVQGALQLEISGHDTVSKQWRSMARSSRLTTSIPVERKLYGRDVEKDSIVELLMKGKTDDLGVLPLVGVGGVGKSTLARFVYHDQRIKDHFDLRIENQEGDPMLQSIGKQIAKALKGSPLAARSVGALLNRSVNFENWRKVQDKWKSLLDQDDDILAILKFSYEFLPRQPQPGMNNF
ncbi:hypothetical protein ABZP36_014515 [Zizania latifolia]